MFKSESIYASTCVAAVVFCICYVVINFKLFPGLVYYPELRHWGLSTEIIQGKVAMDWFYRFYASLGMGILAFLVSLFSISAFKLKFAENPKFQNLIFLYAFGLIIFGIFFYSWVFLGPLIAFS